jgi:hypothetical protein
MLQSYRANVALLNLAGISLFNSNVYVMDDPADSTLGCDFIGKPGESVASEFFKSY